jgi:hypothetical protein
MLIYVTIFGLRIVFLSPCIVQEHPVAPKPRFKTTKPFDTIVRPAAQTSGWT